MLEKAGKLEPYEFINWRIGQTYYVDIASGANIYDPNYSSAVFGANGQPAHRSPLQSRLRIRPTPAVSNNFDLEYDVNFKEIRSLSLSTSVNYRLFGLDARWFRGTYRISINKTRPTNNSDTESAARNTAALASANTTPASSTGRRPIASDHRPNANSANSTPPAYVA